MQVFLVIFVPNFYIKVQQLNVLNSSLVPTYSSFVFWLLYHYTFIHTIKFDIIFVGFHYLYLRFEQMSWN